MITDKLRSYGAARTKMGLQLEHRRHKGLNNRAENSHQPTKRRERIMKRFKSARQAQWFLSIHDQVSNLFHIIPLAIGTPEGPQARSAVTMPSDVLIQIRSQF
jgi:transposase-like protein